MSRIITFYSYKGGVGRTFALANIAVLLAKRGKKVLLMDWDLEAPGLHRYFKSHLSSKSPLEKGLIHLLSQAVESPKIRWESFITEIQIDNSSTIDMISSGDQSADYIEQVQSFSWENFFENRQGAKILDRWRTEWKNSYDFVLIDSRTGITDTGGVCTVFLPDILVLVFSANEQSFERGIQIILGVQESRRKLAVRRPPAAVLPLPSRFDGRDEVDEANRWLDRFSRDLKPFYDDWLPKKFKPRQILELTKIPYITKFSFGEPLPVLSHSISDPEFPGFYLENATRLLATDFQEAALILAPAGSKEKSAIADFRAQLAQVQIDEVAIEKSLILIENDLGECNAMSELLNEAGAVFFRQKRFDSAETYFRRALSIDEREFGTEDSNIIISLNHLAELLHSTKRLLEAEEIYRRVLQLLSKVKKPDIFALFNAYINLAVVVDDMRRSSEAEDYYLYAIGLLNKSKVTDTPTNENRLENERKLVTALNLLGELYQRQGKIDEAVRTLDEVVRIGSSSDQAMALNSLGRVYQREGKFDEALRVLHKSLELFVEMADPRGQVMVLNSLGVIYQRLGDLEKSIDILQQSYMIAEQLGDKRSVAFVLNSLGIVYQRLGNFDATVDAFHKSTVIDAQIGNVYGQATTLNLMGDAYQQQGKFEEAIDVLEQSNKLWQRLGDERGLAIATISLGRSYLKQGKFEKSVKFLHQSNMLLERLGDERGQAMALNSLGEVYLRSGKFEESVDVLRQSDALWARLGDKRRQAAVLNLLADVYQQQGKFEEAKKHFRQSASIGGFEKAVFVSYAWERESEHTVDELEKAFAKRDIRVIRDKKNFEYKGSVEALEQRLGQGQVVVLVISDKYLRSEHCMYELVELEKNRNLHEFIFPIVLADARIYKSIDRLAYIRYWDERITQLNQAIKQIDALTNLTGITSDLDKYARIRNSFDYLTDFLTAMNALTPEIRKASGFSTLISATEGVMAG